MYNFIYYCYYLAKNRKLALQFFLFIVIVFFLAKTRIMAVRVMTSCKELSHSPSDNQQTHFDNVR